MTSGIDGASLTDFERVAAKKLLGRSRKRFNVLSSWNSIIVCASRQGYLKGEGGIEKFSRNCYRERDPKLFKRTTPMVHRLFCRSDSGLHQLRQMMLPQLRHAGGAAAARCLAAGDEHIAALFNALDFPFENS